MPLMPSHAYSYVPCAIRSGATIFAMSMGTANPTPEFAPVLLTICVLMPMTRPRRSSSGPPELPGLMGASVCTTIGIEYGPLPLRIDRPSALTMPLVSVKSCPKGLPMASASCPTRRSSTSPRGSGRSSRAPASIFSTARSELGSPPRNSASYSSPSAKTTLTESEPSTTCQLVRMWPSSSQTKPDPAPRRYSLNGPRGIPSKKSRPNCVSPASSRCTTRTYTTDGSDSS